MTDKRCTCEFRIKMLGDGCRYCQPQEYIDRLHDSMEDMFHPEELSDEEITKLYWQSTWGSDDDAINFARSIIKASRGEE